MTNLLTLVHSRATIERVAKMMYWDSRFRASYRPAAADHIWHKASGQVRRSWTKRAESALSELLRAAQESGMTPPPPGEERVTISKQEYDTLTYMARRVRDIEPKGNIAVEILQLQLERASRARKAGRAIRS